jgi:DNA-binding NarL/FixJ family response regulator
MTPRIEGDDVVRVVLADDSLLLREGLVLLLEEAGYTVAAAVEDAEALLAAVAEHRPDAAVVDVRMPPTHTDEGLRAAVDIRRRFPATAVLLLSQYVERSYLSDLLADGRGGVGYLLKDRVSRLEDLTDAMRRLVDGGTVLDPEVVAQLMVRTGTDPLSRLTPREREVLVLLAEGRSNAAIQARLVLSAGAVEKHIGNIMTKLGLLPSSEDHRRVLVVLRYLNRA